MRSPPQNAYTRGTTKQNVQSFLVVQSSLRHYDRCSNSFDRALGRDGEGVTHPPSGEDLCPHQAFRIKRGGGVWHTPTVEGERVIPPLAEELASGEVGFGPISGCWCDSSNLTIWISFELQIMSLSAIVLHVFVVGVQA